MKTTANAIELRNVERVYPTPGGGVHALRGVTLALPYGALATLTGPSGSGKTTLLNLVAGLDTPTAGSVQVLGAELANLGDHERTALRRRIGLIFQSFALLPTATAYENVELGLRLADHVLRGEWERRVRACLEALSLSNWAHHRPYELSGGQQQRVAIARALAPGPALIIADEPTGDLDERTGRQVLSLLRGLAERAGVAVLIATHDPAAAAYASVSYHLEDGRLAQAALNREAQELTDTLVTGGERGLM
jgi:ABC-type lipoprotein export system ATPase subunit